MRRVPGYGIVDGTSRTPGLVSFIIPCYNGERFVSNAIDSALAQTWPSVEVIAVDDGSTDASASILRSYGTRIRVVTQENRGLPAARNSGIRASSGKFLSFLDADDFLSPDFAAKMVGGLTACNAELAYCGWQNIGATDRSNDPFVPPDYESAEKVESFLRAGSLWPVHAAMIRAEILRDTGGFDESLPTCEDYDFWLRAALTRPIVRVAAVLAFYRHHGSGQMSSDRGRQARYSWLIKRRFAQAHPEVVAPLAKGRLRELINGALYRRGFDAFWRGDLMSAQRIFRILLRLGFWWPKDLKYLLPALLPARAFQRLVSLAERGAVRKR